MRKYVINLKIRLIKQFWDGHKQFFSLTSAAVAAAKSLQLCLTLCSPIDGSPPGSSIPGILQARILEWVAISFSFSSVQSLSHVSLCDLMNCSMPDFPVHHQLTESIQTHVHRVDDAIQPSHPLSSPFFLPSIFPSIRVFFNESALCIRWPKYWSFSFK